MPGPQVNLLPDGRRLHLNHGPIDLIVEALGGRDEVEAGYRLAARRFESILQELVEELPELRRPSRPGAPRTFLGPTARRMEAAVAPLAHDFLTPMAAVAGSVADEVLAAILRGGRLEKVYVNNGGDAAFWIAPGQRLDIAIGGTMGGLDDRIAIDAASGVQGVATSGWPGRSFSLGIADAVTVLASSAAEADAAATVIANAVDLPGHPAIRRVPAAELSPDSDLGTRPVTVAVGRLSADEVEAALEAGLAMARRLADRGAIAGAALFLAGEAKAAGMPASSPSPPRIAALEFSLAAARRPAASVQP